MSMINHDGGGIRKSKILLAEDDPDVRRLLQMQLLGCGYDVRSYASSRALLADITARDAVCLVTDYRMPELDGLALLRSLRQAGWAGKAVLITAYPSPELASKAMAAGFDCSFGKPYRPQDLMDAIARLIALEPS